VCCVGRLKIDHISCRGERKGSTHRSQLSHHTTLFLFIVLLYLAIHITYRSSSGSLGAIECLAGPEPTSSSARRSEHSPSDLPTRQRSQSQSTQQSSKSQPVSEQRRSQSRARVSSAPNPPQSTQANDLCSFFIYSRS
jgi:hypothetical protein